MKSSLHRIELAQGRVRRERIASGIDEAGLRAIVALGLKDGFRLDLILSDGSRCQVACTSDAAVLRHLLEATRPGSGARLELVSSRRVKESETLAVG